MRRSYFPALLTISLSGCAFFAALTGQPQSGSGDPQQDADRQAQLEAQREAEQDQADAELAAKLDADRQAALAETATVEQVLAFVDSVRAALQGGAIERGKVPAEVVGEAHGAIDAALARAGNDSQRATLELLRGDLFVIEGRTDEAAAPYLAAVQLAPTVELFMALANLPKSATTDAAVLTACPTVRPLVGADALTDFVAICLDAASQDRKQLSWKTAKADLKTHDAELARREQERAAAEAAAAEAAAQAQLWTSAAVFAAGRCRFGNCLEDGWETSSDQGTITTNCRFGNCLKDGWETRFPDGSSATTTCRFGDCMKDGWETRLPNGDTARTTCRFGNCPVDGWETSLPDGSTSRTTCRFSDCFKDGWETSLPDGGSIRCNCKFSNCLQDGTECG